MDKCFIQLALDRMNIEEAIRLTQKVEENVGWIEIGTSLIKEFGMKSVRSFRNAFPKKMLLADMKIIDNARYECDLAFTAGANVVTVMGCGPLITVQLVAETARNANQNFMIDLLNTTEKQQIFLRDTFTDAIFCLHTSKDQQERNGDTFRSNDIDWNGRRIAVAGGLNEETLPPIIVQLRPEIFIIGSSITKATNPVAAIRTYQQIIKDNQF